MKVGLISLGCSKNRVDAEVMLGKLKSEGFEITPDAQSADVVIVNTCGFIESAKQESINEILMAAQLKKKSLKYLVVTGCLSQRYGDELAEELPEVDAFLGVANQDEIVHAIRHAVSGERYLSFTRKRLDIDYKNRVLTTPPHYAYIKISEGCNNRCTYCAIPAIRGKMVSRRAEDIIGEAKLLINNGVKEIILVAQDTTRYGEDLYGEPRLEHLIKKIAAINGDFWVRVLYSYPEKITDKLVKAFCSSEKICRYIDIPIQHTVDYMLQKMHRRGGYADIIRAKELLKDFTVRSTVIAGFPAETIEEHELNLSRLRELSFDRLGSFAYSQEDSTLAAGFDGQIDEDEKVRRAEEIMEMQSEVSLYKNVARVGQVCRVLVDGFNGEMYFGRSQAEAPEVDGSIFIHSNEALTVGEFVMVKITEAFEYDLMGDAV